MTCKMQPIYAGHGWQVNRLQNCEQSEEAVSHNSSSNSVNVSLHMEWLLYEVLFIVVVSDNCVCGLFVQQY